MLLPQAWGSNSNALSHWDLMVLITWQSVTRICGVASLGIDDPPWWPRLLQCLIWATALPAPVSHSLFNWQGQVVKVEREWSSLAACQPLELSLGVFGAPLSAGLWLEERWKAHSHLLIPRSSLMFMKRPLLTFIGVTPLTFAGHCKNQKDFGISLTNLIFSVLQGRERWWW